MPWRRNAAVLKRPDIKPDDIVVLQYTGGTGRPAPCCCTNVIANVQSKPERSGHGSLEGESSLFMSARCRSTISSLSRST
jgi:hypothetical protein